MSELKGVLAEMYDEGKVGWQAIYNKELKDSNITDIIIESYSPSWLPSYKYIETVNGFGEEHWTIFSWKGKYYKAEYRHRSHADTEYYGDGSDIIEVVPKIVEKTVWV